MYSAYMCRKVHFSVTVSKQIGLWLIACQALLPLAQRGLGYNDFLGHLHGIPVEVHPAEGVGHFLVLEDPAFVAKMVRNLVSQS